MLEVYLGQFEEIWPTKTFFYKSLETHSGSGNLYFKRDIAAIHMIVLRF